MDLKTTNQTRPDDADLVELGSVSDETKGRIMQPLEFGVSPTSRDEAG